MLFFFPRGVLGEILNLIESVSGGFPSYVLIESFSEGFPTKFFLRCIGYLSFIKNM